MNFKNQLQSEMENQSRKLAMAASVHLLPIAALIGQLYVFWLSGRTHLFPQNDALMNIISCCAQIIAGLYGITLAGYTFFLSRIDSLMVSDATLGYIVGSIKQRFKLLIWYITATVAVTLFMSVFLMYYPVSSNVIPAYFYRVICNEFVLFLAFSIALILYYSVGVVDPNCIRKEARRLKRKLEGRNRLPGSAVEYISLYDRIEQRCNGMLPENVVGQIHENKGKQFEYTVELLREHSALVRAIAGDLLRIHRYYECLVNCAQLHVTREMCLLAGKVLDCLEQTEAEGSVRN